MLSRVLHQHIDRIASWIRAKDGAKRSEVGEALGRIGVRVERFGLLSLRVQRVHQRRHNTWARVQQLLSGHVQAFGNYVNAAHVHKGTHHLLIGKESRKEPQERFAQSVDFAQIAKQRVDQLEWLFHERLEQEEHAVARCLYVVQSQLQRIATVADDHGQRAALTQRQTLDELLQAAFAKDFDEISLQGVLLFVNRRPFAALFVHWFVGCLAAAWSFRLFAAAAKQIVFLAEILVVKLEIKALTLRHLLLLLRCGLVRGDLSWKGIGLVDLLQLVQEELLNEHVVLVEVGIHIRVVNRLVQVDVHVGQVVATLARLIFVLVGGRFGQIVLIGRGGHAFSSLLLLMLVERAMPSAHTRANGLLLIGNEIYGEFEQKTHKHVTIAQDRLHRVDENGRALVRGVLLRVELRVGFLAALVVNAGRGRRGEDVRIEIGTGGSVEATTEGRRGRTRAKYGKVGHWLSLIRLVVVMVEVVWLGTSRAEQKRGEHARKARAWTHKAFDAETRIDADVILNEKREAVEELHEQSGQLAHGRLVGG